MIRHLHPFIFLLFAGGLSLTTASLAAAELRDGDRIALVGNTFIEREGTTGHIETALLLSHAELNLTFRNYGWSGDTVRGAARGYFKPQEGYGLLLKDVAKSKPTVILLNYGANAAWGGEAGVAEFRAGLGQPVIGLYLGEDFKDPVGKYKVPNKFNGKIHSHKTKVKTD